MTDVLGPPPKVSSLTKAIERAAEEDTGREESSLMAGHP